MRTVDGLGASDSRLGSIVRDAKLVVRLASMLAVYLTRGAIIRYRYRRLARQGRVYWLDEDA